MITYQIDVKLIFAVVRVMQNNHFSTEIYVERDAERRWKIKKQKKSQLSYGRPVYIYIYMYMYIEIENII